ncbi:hypothetical protein G5B40_15950 [Pikeienuella piscinae]|uniref:Uncharacterized protein n=1 Tax=Pikeienuella piscinae TaxID=2748098 RepID=A0A7L5C1V4_9RHOB|nr:hypothetical protein [Pikeienuella piscinae]QIE56797.1 hypothetical protein G5B40_15950 [Pikeienuella piscinae]
MKDVFLGRPVHWLVVLALIACGWIAGGMRLHVTDFNLYVIALGLLSAAALAIVIWTTGDSEQVTRDPIEGEETE